MRKLWVMVAGLLVLGLVNYSIWSKEQQLATGRVMYLQLAPVDPRSLMQGDYMALNYAIVSDIHAAMPKQPDSAQWGGAVDASGLQFGQGAAVVTLDERSVAQFVRLHEDGAAPLAAGEYLLRFRVREGQIKFATNAYFFEEGTADIYASAAYGLFRVSEDGEPLLTHMCDAELNVLGADSS
jgi:uncharacterized membrane-anchored protein